LLLVTYELQLLPKIQDSDTDITASYAHHSHSSMRGSQ